MASELVDSVLRTGRYQDYELLQELSADDMQRLSYEHPLLDLIPRQREIDHGVYAADFVTAENTGCVHIAPGHGLEDYELGMEHHLEIFCPVGEDGRYTAGAGRDIRASMSRRRTALSLMTWRREASSWPREGWPIAMDTAGAARPHHLHRHQPVVPPDIRSQG